MLQQTWCSRSQHSSESGGWFIVDVEDGRDSAFEVSGANDCFFD